MFLEAMKTQMVARVLAGVAMVAVLAVQPGCLIVAAGAAGASTVAYVRGDLMAPLDADYESAVKASRRALDKLEFKIIDEKRDALAADFVARTALDKKVQVRVTKQGEKVTQIRIRVGVFGDEALSMTVLNEIKQRL